MLNNIITGMNKYITKNLFFIVILLMFLGNLLPLLAQDDIGNEYRITVFPSHKISGNISGFGYLGYVWNPVKKYQTYYLGWPAGMYIPNKWLQVWGGIVMMFTNNEIASDKLELRPFTGVKLFLPNSMKWNIYSFTRYEFRAIQERNSREWTNSSRLRNRFGIEIPLTSNLHAWQPKTFYALADAEPYYRFDKGQVDPFRIRAGVGYIMDGRIRMEFIYHAQYTHPNGSSLKYTDNIFRLNIKIGLNKGIINQQQNPEIDE